MLVVEPDLALRTALTYTLRNEGHLVLALGDAKLAQEVTRENPLSFLLLDPVGMDTDALELRRIVRSNPLTERLPIVLLLTRERKIAQVEQLGLRITDYLLKPLLWEEVRACVQTLVRGHKHETNRRAKPVTRTLCVMLPKEERVVIIGDLLIDFARRSVARNGQLLDFNRP